MHDMPRVLKVGQGFRQMQTCTSIKALFEQSLWTPCCYLQVTALWVTHRLEELDWADSVSYMDRGRIQFSGSPREAAAYLKRLGAHV